MFNIAHSIVVFKIWLIQSWLMLSLKLSFKDKLKVHHLVHQ